MSEITVWQRWTKYEEKGRTWYNWEHNHISDGFDPSLEKPIGKFEFQTRGWKGSTWRALKARLVNGIIELDQ